MRSEAYVVVALVLLALLAMTRSYLVPELALLGVLVILLALGIVRPAEALEGFASESLHTVALLFVVSAAIKRSGALTLLTGRYLGRPRGDLDAQTRLIVPTAILSSVLNNTPVVALFLPVVRDWAKRHGLAPSRLLIPLSYASILGGVCTLIGTSTNLVVRGLLPPPLHDRFGMFTIGRLGLPAALGGMGVLWLLGRRLLPAHPDPESVFADPRTFTTELLVNPEGPLVGRRLAEVRRGDRLALHPVEIDRRGTILPAPSPEEVLQAGDRLVLAGAAAAAVAVHRIDGLDPTVDRVADSQAARRHVFELVVSPRCPLVGRTVGDGSFRRHYNGAVMAVARHGQSVRPGGINGWVLQVGDTLLVETDRGFLQTWGGSADFLVIRGHDEDRVERSWHPMGGALILAAMIALAATDTLSTFMAAALAVTALLLTRILPWEDAVRALDARVLLTIAAALGVGGALESTGAAAAMAHALVRVNSESPHTALALLYLTTVVCTELVTNNAAAVIMIPLALASAAQLNVDPMAFVVAVAIGASASFITPIGYQTNLMVYGPGGYRFSDFVRAGLPVSLVVALVTILLGPVAFPFAP